MKNSPPVWPSVAPTVTTFYAVGLDYERIGKIFQKANYSEFVSLEMEGKENPKTSVPKSPELLRRVFTSTA